MLSPTARPAIPKSYVDAVSKVLASFFEVLDTFGRQPSGTMLDAWLLAFYDRGVAEEEVLAAGRFWLANRTSLPKPSEVSDWIIDQRKRDQLEANLRLVERG